MNIKCILLGHIPYKPNVLNGNSLLEVRDKLGASLVKVDVCSRCGAVYSNLKNKGEIR